MNYLIILIFIVSIYYSFKYKFIQFKCFRKTKEILVNKKSKSAYSTFMVSLANHIGVGNIEGTRTVVDKRNGFRRTVKRQTSRFA